MMSWRAHAHASLVLAPLHSLPIQIINYARASPSSREPKRARIAGHDANVTSLVTSLGGSISSMAVTSSGTCFVCTRSALFAISKCGMQSLLAGHRTDTGYTDGQGGEARFNRPHGITVNGDGNLLVSDTYNHALRKVTLSGAVSTLAGKGQHKGFSDGVGATARFNEPWGIVVDAKGAIFVADSDNHCVRQIEPGDGKVTTLVGVGEAKGFADGQRAAARFNEPAGLALDVDGDLIVADVSNSCIRKVMTAEGRVSTVAGCAGQHEFADGEGVAAHFYFPQGVAVDGSNIILVADKNNHRIRMIAGANARVTTVAGNAEAGAVDGASARFNKPMNLVLDEGGRLLVTEYGRLLLRVVEASLAPPLRLPTQPIKNPLSIPLQDYGKMLDDTELADVTFAVDGQRFPAHRCVLAARSPYFSGLFKSCKGMREGEGSAVGHVIVIDDVSARAFRALLLFLYSHNLPEAEDFGKGLEVWEMALVADRFQALALYEHCIQHFRQGLKVDNAIERLVQAHDSGLDALQQAAWEFVLRHYHAIQVCRFFQMLSMHHHILYILTKQPACSLISTSKECQKSPQV